MVRRLYREGDERRFEARPDFAALLAATGGQLPPGPKWTITQGREPIAVGGFIPGPKVYSAWAYCSGMNPRQWRFAFEAARELLGLAVDYYQAKAVEVMVRCDQSRAFCLLAELGFRATGEQTRHRDGSLQDVMALEMY